MGERSSKYRRGVQYRRAELSVSAVQFDHAEEQKTLGLITEGGVDEGADFGKDFELGFIVTVAEVPAVFPVPLA